MRIKQKNFSGTKDPNVQQYEIENRKIARMAAAQGMVLLKNENMVLPIEKEKKIALYGAGAAVMIKGGMGSGDVNAREVINIYQGLKDAGYVITTEEWIKSYLALYEKERRIWRQKIWDKEDSCESGKQMSLFNAYSSTPFVIPAGDTPEKTDTDTAIYVLVRNAGEGRDRVYEEGDYLLTEEESVMVKQICRLYRHVILILNIGGIVDLSFVDQYPQIEGILYAQQPGMEGGHAVADIISGEVTPSGKLTDTWALHYEDYPSSRTFSHNDMDVEHEKYEEGIYVGYRYFDTYEIPVRYGFGYGLSYTTFEMSLHKIAVSNQGTDDVCVRATVQVTNTGMHYGGKEVVQMYICPPQKKMEKEYRRLVGFAKTKFLKPGESQEITIDIPLAFYGSYREKTSEWYIEQGDFGMFLGASLEDAKLVAVADATEEIILSKQESICKVQEEIHEMQGNKENSEKRRALWKMQAKNFPVVYLYAKDVLTQIVTYEQACEDISEDAWKFVDTLSKDEWIQLVTGDSQKAQGSALGSAGSRVPGSAAETYSIENKELVGIVLADGPAGLRLNRKYYVKDGKIQPSVRGIAIENGFLCRDTGQQQGEVYYQYCTAFPVGTLLAQSWDTELVEKCGKAVQKELAYFGVTLWLAPGMNIHRNPLCGRNFEYYSEDPVLSGYMAAAMTKGVQSQKGYGTTIKHFACNNQEDNRMATDSIVGERTLREIYLRGFEIAVKKAHPMALMTSYNLVNGVYTANSYDLCTKVLRNEWKYQGIIMTDWTTTMQETECTAAGCMRAGNDLVMPGCAEDHQNIREELQAGRLDIKDVKRSAARLVQLVWNSDNYD